MQKPSMVSSLEKTTLALVALGALLVLALFMLVGWLARASDPAAQAVQEDQPAEIAVLCPLSGPQAGQCQSLQAVVGAMTNPALSRDFLPAGNLVRPPLAMVAYDSGSTPDQAASAARKAAANPGTIAIIGPLDARQLLAVAETVAGSGLVVISPASTAPSLDTAAFPNLYRVPAQDSYQGQALVDFVSNILGLQKIYFIAEPSDHVNNILNLFNQASRNRLQVLGSLQISTAEPLSGVATAIKQSQAQVVVYLGGSARAAEILREMGAAQLNMPFVGIDTLNAEGLRPLPAGVGPVYYSSALMMLTARDLQMFGIQSDLSGVMVGQPFAFETLRASYALLMALDARQPSQSRRQAVAANLETISQRSSNHTGQMLPQTIYLYQVNPQATSAGEDTLAWQYDRMEP
jgi:ABC-type branched-subunit amino acid transport system substrate-binding protein